MKIVFFILLIFLLLVAFLLLMPLRIKAVGHTNILSKQAFVSVKVLWLNISAKIYLLNDNTFSVIHNADALLEMDSDKIDSVMLFKCVLQKLKIKNLDFIIDAGKVDDAFATAMAISLIKSIMGSVVAVFDKKIESFQIKTTPIYNSSEIILSIRLRIGIRPIDIIISHIKAKKQKQKGVQNA